MGIKRTAAGRIYFDAGEDPVEERRDGGDRQSQVLGLLGQLGDRLQRSENDREELVREVQEYRRTVSDLEEKAARAEKIVAALQGRIAKFDKLETDLIKRQEKFEKEFPGQNEKLEAEIARRQEKLESEIAQKQGAFEKAAQEQNQKIARASQNFTDLERRLKGAETVAGLLEGRISESVEQQARLNRRLEKISQDKVRLLRKIERMEEVVSETQEALRARAMVLLTDQTLAAGAGARIALPAPDSAANDSRALFEADVAAPWWQKPLRVRGAALAGIVGAALALGWVSASLMRPEVVAPAAEQEIAAFEDPARNDSGADGETKIAQAEPPPLNIDSEGPPIAAPSMQEVSSEAQKIEKIDEEELLAAFTENPAALAAQLNAIEPGASPPQTADDSEAQKPESGKLEPEARLSAPAAAKEKELETVQIASIAPPKAAEERGASKTPAVPAPAVLKSVTGAKPDPALPPKAKAIEGKAIAGFPESQHDLAALYTAGRDGVKQDYTRAAFWFRESAKGGLANAAYNLGVLHHQGLGVRKDMSEAIRWYNAAAEKGHPEAQYNLGIAFIEGIGVAYDPAAAAKHFESAAAGGVVEAAYNLGMIHENGLLGAPQPDIALVWYKTAADKGSPEARLALEQLAKTLGLDPAALDRIAPPPSRQGAAIEPASARAVSAGGARALPGMDLPVDDVLGHPDTVAASSIDHVVVSQIQQQLRAMGLYGGRADGVSGEKTAEAIRSYQSVQGLPVDGIPTEALLVHMLAHDPGGTLSASASGAEGP